MPDGLSTNGFFGPLFSDDAPDAKAVPCIKISFIDPKWDHLSGTAPSMVMRDVTALLDTGASSCFVDRSILDKLNYPSLRTGLSHGMFDTEEAESVRGVFAIEDVLQVYSMELVKNNLENNAFKVILGWGFLSYWKLHFDQSQGIVRLTK